MLSLADRNTAIPSDAGLFGGFQRRSVKGSNFVFMATGFLGQQGIYKYFDGSLSRIADLTTAIPDGIGNFSVLGAGQIDFGNKPV